MRLLRPLVVTLAGAACVLPLGTAPAHADVLDVTCAVSSDVTYTPGLTLTEQQVSVAVDAEYTGCISTSRPDITSGRRTGTFPSTRSCLNPPTPNSTTAVITWNTGETSTLGYETSVTTAAGQTVFTAEVTVTAGVFAGQTGTEVIAQATPSVLDCLAPGGVTHQTGLGSFNLLA